MKSARGSVRNMFRFWIVLLAAVIMTGCGKNEVEVEFSITADRNNTYSMIYYASDKKKGLMIEEMVVLQGGKAIVKCPTVNPTLVYVHEAGISGKFPLVFYMERGDKIRITGSGSEPLSWNVEGNKISESLSAWRKRIVKTLTGSNSSPAATIEALNKSVAEYVATNPESPVSTILLLIYYDRRADEAGFLDCWARLKGEAKKAEWIRLVPRSDVDPDMNNSGKLPPWVVLKTLDTGCDTVNLKGKPVLLHFTHRDAANHDEDMRMLRDVSEYADSSSRVIADISTDADSTFLSRQIRLDSIKGITRAWMPLGVSDIVSRNLGVRRVPYNIVVDASGRVAYRGDDMQKAVSAFRPLLNARKRD